MHVPWRLASPRDNGQNHVHRRQRIELDNKVQLASQVYSTTASDESAESGSSSGQSLAKARFDASMATGKGKEPKGDYSVRKRKHKESSLSATVMDFRVFSVCRVGTKAPKIHKTGRVPKWHCKGRVWNQCSFFLTRLVCVSNDISKSDGCCFEVIKMRWSDIEDLVVLLGRNLYRPFGGLMWERHFEEDLLELVSEKVSNEECLFVYREYALLLSVYVEDEIARRKPKEAEYGSHVQEIDETRWSWRTNFISSSHIYFGCSQSECKPNEISFDEFTKMFESRFSAGATENLNRVGKASRTNGCMVLRRRRRCSKMRWATLWIGKQESDAAIQRLKSFRGWSSFQERSQVCSQIVLKCLY